MRAAERFDSELGTHQSYSQVPNRSCWWGNFPRTGAKQCFRRQLGISVVGCHFLKKAPRNRWLRVSFLGWERRVWKTLSGSLEESLILNWITLWCNQQRRLKSSLTDYYSSHQNRTSWNGTFHGNQIYFFPITQHNNIVQSSFVFRKTLFRGMLREAIFGMMLLDIRESDEYCLNKMIRLVRFTDKYQFE